MALESVHRKTFIRKLRAMLVVDVVESVRLMEQDEEDTIRRWRDFISVVTAVELPARRGRMVKSLGDGMLVEFESVVDAVQAAVAMLALAEQGNAGYPNDRHIRLRAGVHLADVVIDDLDVFGDGVNLAARLAALGGPQEIIVSAAVRDQLTDGLDVTLDDLGEQKLKNMQRLVRAYRASPAQSPQGARRKERRA